MMVVGPDVEAENSALPMAEGKTSLRAGWWSTRAAQLWRDLGSKWPPGRMEVGGRIQSPEPETRNQT